MTATLTSDVEMLGNAQVTDTTRNVFGLAGRIHYVDSLAKVTMTRKPAVISQTTEEDGSTDTLYLGAERLVYYTVKMCDVDSLAVVDAAKRVETMNVDPVGEYRKKAAEEAARAAEEAAKNDPKLADKPEAALVKILDGKVRKVLSEVCLLEQEFVKEPGKKVSQVFTEAGSAVVTFVRYGVGEGMQKKEENFADEVMAQVNK